MDDLTVTEKALNNIPDPEVDTLLDANNVLTSPERIEDIPQFLIQNKGKYSEAAAAEASKRYMEAVGVHPDTGARTEAPRISDPDTAAKPTPKISFGPNL